jgi:ferredoxin
MAASKQHRIIFSPTGTTDAVVAGICRGTERTMGNVLDLTRSAGEAVRFGKDDLVVVGMPVYSGRLPQLAVERFSNLRGDDTPAAAVVVYGNRAYDDALLELGDLCTAQGFRVVGAAAFVGEHSFSSPDLPVAKNRPDAADLRKAEEFGRWIAAKSEPLDFSGIPGNRPHKALMDFPGAAAGSDSAGCVQCGQCAEACPADAIHMGSQAPETDPERCVWCSACVKACPVHARSITLPKIREIVVRLNQMCQTRREPEWYPATFVVPSKIL